MSNEGVGGFPPEIPNARLNHAERLILSTIAQGKPANLMHLSRQDPKCISVVASACQLLVAERLADEIIPDVEGILREATCWYGKSD